MSENRFDAAAHARSMRDGGFWVDKPKTPARRVQKFQPRELARAFAERPHKANA
jgi:hypothetical protein